MSRLGFEWGPSRKILLQRLESSNLERDEWRHTAGKLRADRDHLVAQMNALEEQEPSTVPGCRKVRLHNQYEAEAFILKVAMTMSEDPRDYHTYRCPDCPRHPLTGKFWHIGHRVPGWKRALKKVQEEKMPDDEPEQTRWWWTCAFGCGTGGGESSSAEKDEAKASHEQFCSKNPNNK
jgi:hypothetical protein